MAPGEKHDRVVLSFVVHEHAARTHHYDFRLEKDGVLKSWAVPKGLPPAPGKRRLAIETEDHPLEYLDFAGTIPEGEYGAGQVTIWDTGTYTPLEWGRERIEFVLHGVKLQGKYVMFRFARAGTKEWIVLKAKEQK
jgi:bifunctional non-homologous end joining protein LigD